MSILLDANLSVMQRAVKEALRTHWRLFLIEGIVMIVLGVLAIAAPMLATMAIEIYIGWLFLISGIIGLIAMFSADDMHAFLWSLLTAALSVAVGVLLVWRPLAGEVSLTIVLIAFFIAEGVFQTVSSISYRKIMPGSWGWMLASGLSDLVLAAIIIAAWPVSAVWTLGLIVGVNLITSGWAIVIVALAGRSAAQPAAPTMASAH